MMRTPLTLVAALALLVAASPQSPAPAEPPTDWTDPATGHRVVRLSKEPGTASLYFHQNPYTATGDKFVVTTPAGISTIEWKTREIRPIVVGRAGLIVVGPKTRQVFYRREGAVYATHLDTGETREITRMPAELRGGSGFGVNADETLLAGSAVVGDQTEAERRAAQAPPANDGRLGARLALRLPMVLYTVNIKTGEVKTFHPATDWLNHVQMSPSDPGLILFCHEGPWHLVERIWTIRADGSDLKKIHARTQDMEIWGHEFFSPDGNIIWYDWQTPKGKEFWLAGYEVRTGKRHQYRVEREHWSVHYNASPTENVFAGDGGGPHSVAAPGNGQWIYLFRPRGDRLEAERLVNLEKHDYRLEPNVTFTPDGKWIVFRSNMHGATHVYAVEVKKAR
jgi:oligogalacturonide lyase